MDPELRVEQEIEDAYKEMGKLAGYWPAATAEHGGRPRPEELRAYADGWWREEEEGTYHVGRPSGEGRKTLIWVVEAARLMCGVEYVRAQALLKRAAEEVDRVIAERRAKGLPDSIPL